MNHIWFFLMITGMTWAAASGNTNLISKTIFEQSKEAIFFALNLGGGIAFWSGLMKIAEESGITTFLGKITSKPLSILFPSLKKHPEAMKAISLSLWANIFGLGNAGTPLGLKAMHELQKVNKDKQYASDAMCTYMALVMSGLTFLPSTVLILRNEAGSMQPGIIIIPTIFATMIGTITALSYDRMCRKNKLYKIRNLAEMNAQGNKIKRVS